MNQGREFSIPWEKGVTQNGNTWVPSTPDKPVLPRSNNAQSEVPLDQMGGENWRDLVDMYGELLGNKKPHKFDLNTTLVPNYRDHNNQGVDPVETYTRLQQNSNPTEIVGTNIRMQNSQDVAPVEFYQRLPLNYSPAGCSGVSNVEHNSQDVSTLQKCGSLNQNAGKVGCYAQNLGEVVPPQKINSLGEAVPPQKVTFLAELVGMKSALRDLSSNGSLNRSTNFVGKPITTCLLSQVEQNQVAYRSVGAGFQQSHIFHESNQAAYAMVGAKLDQSRILHVSHDDSRYNLEEIPNSRLPVPNHNLTLPPRSEAGESSSAARPLPLGPVTPDQKKQSKPHQIIQVPHLFIDEVSTQEKYMQDNVVVRLEPEIRERDHNDISPNPMGTSSAAISTSLKEMNSCDGGNGEIDLNKTPQQKIPKRRKHRPKVVVEGKPKRSSKPAVTKVNTPVGDPPTKRKYVRKNATNNSTPPPTDAVKVAEASDVGPPTKSCKRRLNFGMGNGAVKESLAGGLDYQEQRDQGSKLPLDLNLGFHNEELPTELNGPPTSVGLKAGHENAYGQEKQQTQTTYNFVHSTNEIPPQESMPLATTVPPPKARDHALNILARIMNARNANFKQCTDQNKYNQVDHLINGGIPQVFFQKNTSDTNSCYRTQSAVQNTPQVLEDLVDVSEKQGTKRGYTQNVLRNQHAIDLMGSQVWPQGVSDPRYCNRNSSLLWQNCLETGKKKNVEEKFHGTSSSMHAGITKVQDFPWQTGSRMNHSFHAQSSTAHAYGESAYSDCRRQAFYRNPYDESTKVSCDHYMNYPDVRHKFQQQHTSSQVHLYSEIMTPKTSHDSANTQITKFIAAVTNRDLESASHRNPKPIPINKNINSPVRIAANRQTARQTTSKKVNIVDNIFQQEPKIMRRYRQSSKKIAGTQYERRNSFSIDDITNCMKDLQITDNGKEIGWKERTALVPYRGDGAVVPYEDFNLVKKKRPRPRVDLDPETNRLWNLLMGKEAGESAETMDTDREKWWDEERKVFRGRVDSFIARMHLVQGDRRFSKWKGSVVDSVIGVFLTQNVSDHLSSSAFMSLAAKFPLKSTTVGQPCCENGGGPSVEHHEVHISYPDGTTFCDKMVKERVYGHSSVISTDISECQAENVMPEKRTEEDIISSQSSSESFVLQASEDIRSSSGSNSDAEGGWNLNKNLAHVNVSEQAGNFAVSLQYQFQSIGNSNPSKKPLIGHQQLEKEAYSQSPGRAGISSTNSNPFISKTQHDQSSVLPSTDSWPKMRFGMQNWVADGLASFGKERTFTLASKDSDITNETGVECKHAYIGQSADSAFTISQGGRPKSQPSSVNEAVLNKCFELQTESLNESYKRNGQHFIKHIGGKQEAFRQESILIDPRRPTEASSTQQSENRKHSEVGTEMRLEHSSDKPSTKTSATTPNARKRKAEKEKAEPFNWDTLRKQVQSMSGTIERSREAMDSMDYEALLNADVREISDAIKERGMNNLLAERMKDFLDRLVQDHERVDLEWLRDVDPDKAKDYLLSIRGLGLKSVECIRLLTLHHLAFPVDTNVGRIAVRLGWVPLQPLPESLQLHLLELYPVLESIQKYLWPRLCKLNQETLYELHYQMITFGKVFCTKREPNCNACPMRGECRHFASAFASARLALPAPQERHIVSSAAPFSAHKSPEVTIKPMALPPSEDYIVWGKGLTGDCEPLIEEPTTPESPTQEAERDIEDAFYDDPDEIPVIKLDVEEFTTNLQSFIQEHKEMGEGDMSRALVALSPGRASIPVPKLKNINRLRTEHQVYELPDSHPLLKGMDRREPDDPSPYLLAIWTPGETADSIQPPESKCSSMEGRGLCDKATCFSCSSTREAQAQTVRGTILIPCRTAMRGSFPLNGTYFQVNEVFADHESSLNPIDVPRSFLWNLPRRTVFFGSSVTSIFKGLSTEGIQYCFWKGFVCVRGFDQKNRAPRPLKARLHFPASKMAKHNELR